MQMDREVRERILRTLRWLVRDAEYRFNDVKQNLQPGSEGGYSPELKEALKLLRDLEQGDLPLANPIAHSFYSEQDCVEMGATVGMPYKDVVEFFLHYGRQGWLLGNGLPITDLRLAMRDWKNRGQEEVAEPVRNAHGKTPRQLDRERNG